MEESNTPYQKRFVDFFSLQMQKQTPQKPIFYFPTSY